MTQDQFLQEFRTALRSTNACPFLHTPHLWPRGGYVRIQVRPPHWTALPGAQDPVGLVWYARTQEFRSVLDGPRLALGLGLSDEDASDLLLACDTADRLSRRQQGWRAGVLGVLRAVFPQELGQVAAE